MTSSLQPDPASTHQAVLSMRAPAGQRGIPMDVLSTVMALVGRAYPDAHMGSDDGGGVVLLLPERARPVAVTDAQIADAVQVPDPLDPAFLEWRDGPVFTVPEVLAHSLAPLALALLGEAENYVEQSLELSGRHTGQPLVITVARSGGRTPHQLRQDAEAELAALRDLVGQWRAHPGLTLSDDGTVHLQDTARP